MLFQLLNLGGTTKAFVPFGDGAIFVAPYFEFLLKGDK